jgi:signal transduction protein with GAF and PtsI domain
VLGSSDDETLRERAVEMETLSGRILQLLATAAGTPAPTPPPGRVHAAERLTVFEAVELARSHGVACVLAGSAAASPGVDVARALGLPVVCDVRTLFRWAQDDDRALVDGDAGTVLLNPSRADVAALRRDRGAR